MYCMECWKYVGLTLTWDVLKQSDAGSCKAVPAGLTLTWDVLKHLSVPHNQGTVQINFNMGCIETYRIHTVVIQLLLINFNMGCIETRKQK